MAIRIASVIFASARPARIASPPPSVGSIPQPLCLSASCADCFVEIQPLEFQAVLCLSASCADCFAVVHLDDAAAALCLSASCADCFTAADLAGKRFGLCLSASCADCFITMYPRSLFVTSLPQRVLRGLLPYCLPLHTMPLFFASARPARIASSSCFFASFLATLCLSASCADCFPTLTPTQRTIWLCLSASCADCFAIQAKYAERLHPLPQRVLRGLLRPR